MYKPPYKTNETINGLAKVTKAKKGEERYFRVVLTTGKGDDASTTEHFIKPANAPGYLKAGEWRVRMSSDKVKVLSAVPSDAIVTVEFADIVHREGEDPVPAKRSTQYGDVFQFTWLWRATEGEYEGIEIPHYLNYNFDYETDDKGNDVIAYSHPKSKYTEQLDQVLTAAGVWNKGAMAYRENILPVIKKRAVFEREEHGVKAKLTINNGYVIAVKPASGGWDEEADEVKEEVAEKKPAQKAKKAKVEEPVDEDVKEVETDEDAPWDTDDTEET